MFKYRKTGGLVRGIIEAGLFYTPFLIFFILLLLSLFAVPAAEDLSINHYDHVLGLRVYIERFYHSDCSRFFSFPLIFILCDGGFLLGHYYVAGILLLIGLWGVVFFFVRVFAGLVFAEVVTGKGAVGKISGKWIAWLAMVLVLGMSSNLFEVSSMFYWFSGSMTYLFSFLLFGLLVTILLRSAGKGRMGVAGLLLCLVLAACITGSNEIALYFFLITLIWGQLVHRAVTRKWFVTINLMLGVVLICVVLIIIPGGTAHRAGNFKLNFPVAKGLLVATEYTIRIFFRVLSLPLVWFCLALAYLAGSFTREGIARRLATSWFFRPVNLLLLIFLAVFGLYFLVYVFSAELLPPRANNLILFYVFSFLLVSGYSYGLVSVGTSWPLQTICRQPVIKAFIFLLLLTSPLLYRGGQDLVIGVVYKQIMLNREKKILAARQTGAHRVLLNRYEEDFDSIGAGILPAFLQVQFVRKGAIYPGLIHHQDPLADTGLYIHYYAEYYLIDTIRYLGIDYSRIGLMETDSAKKGMMKEGSNEQ